MLHKNSRKLPENRKNQATLLLKFGKDPISKVGQSDHQEAMMLMSTERLYE